MTAEGIFQVHVLVFEEPESARSWEDFLEEEESIMGSAARIKLNVEFTPGNDDLLQRMENLIAHTTTTRVIAVSKTFGVRDARGAWQATPMVRKVRDLFCRNSNHLCGLIAVLNDQPHRISDIDAVINSEDVAPSSFKRKLLQVATGLWLKSPLAVRSRMAGQDVVLVRSVQSAAELQECFKLRHQVYDALGYLEEPVSRSASGIDIDSFDTKAIHFAAIDHRSNETVGTARLVTTVSPFNGKTPIGDPWRIIREQAEWTRIIASQALLEEDYVFRQKLNQPIDMPFPMLLNSDFGTKYRKFMEEHPPSSGGEVSRVVVSPLRRGLGISAMLMRAVISAAFHLKKQFLLLECVPAHARMYERYGFRLLAGHHFRAQDLDQLAVGMSLALDNHPFNKAVAFAKSDGRMLGQSGFVCLCANGDCWKRRDFQLRGNETRCPLSTTRRGLSMVQSEAG